MNKLIIHLYCLRCFFISCIREWSWVLAVVNMCQDVVARMLWPGCCGQDVVARMLWPGCSRYDKCLQAVIKQFLWLYTVCGCCTEVVGM